MLNKGPFTLVEVAHQYIGHNRRALSVNAILASTRRGELSPERSFYFRGPDKALNLRAQNPMMFVQIADGVNERTWEHHRKGGDYSRWLGRHIKDAALAEEAALIENDIELNTSQARAAIRAAVEKRYTAPKK